MIKRFGRGGKGATLAEVARLAGVSAMTASRVINGDAHVRQSKREAVQAAVRALNYSPNPAARTLAAGSVGRLGLVYANPSAAFLSEFLVGALDACRASHFHLVLEKCEEDAEVDAVEALVESGVDGLMLPAPFCDSGRVLRAVGDRVAAVAVATAQPREDITSVRIDDFAASQSMTRRLLALGHRRIGFIKGHPNQTASRERLRGHLAALEEARLAPEPELVVQGFFSFRSGMAASEQLLDLGARPSAIFASNDDMAAAVIAVAHRRGLDVPGELSVCGFDDSGLATNVWPELTTIRQPIADMARQAVAALAAQIRSRGQGESGRPRDILLPYELVARGSDGPRRT